jgi:hypothetical protein
MKKNILAVIFIMATAGTANAAITLDPAEGGYDHAVCVTAASDNKDVDYYKFCTTGYGDDETCHPNRKLESCVLITRPATIVVKAFDQSGKELENASAKFQVTSSRVNKETYGDCDYAYRMGKRNCPYKKAAAPAPKPAPAAAPAPAPPPAPVLVAPAPAAASPVQPQAATPATGLVYAPNADFDMQPLLSGYECKKYAVTRDGKKESCIEYGKDPVLYNPIEADKDLEGKIEKVEKKAFCRTTFCKVMLYGVVPAVAFTGAGLGIAAAAGAFSDKVVVNQK